MQMFAIEAGASKIISLLESKFILSPGTSSLDLIPNGGGGKFRRFNWQRDDYRGNGGPNQEKAGQLVNELNAIRPERRVHVGKDAAVTQGEFRGATATKSTPIFRRCRRSRLASPARASSNRSSSCIALHRLAVRSFVKMREDALADGVVLVVLFGHRSAAAAKAGAAAASSGFAAAKWSAHILGLAGDFRMSVSVDDGKATQAKQFDEATMRPMGKVVEMRQTPAHKWLFLKGAAYSWYPYQDEPWHFEYNPPGLRDEIRR